MAQKPMRIAQIKERRAVPVGKIALTRLHCQKAFLVNRMLSLIRDTAERTGLSVKPGVARIGANRLVGPVSGLRQGDPDAKRIPPIPKSGTPDPRSGTPIESRRLSPLPSADRRMAVLSEKSTRRFSTFRSSWAFLFSYYHAKRMAQALGRRAARRMPHRSPSLFSCVILGEKSSQPLFPRGDGRELHLSGHIGIAAVLIGRGDHLGVFHGRTDAIGDDQNPILTGRWEAREASSCPCRPA